MAVACRQEGLRHDNFYSALQQGRIAYHDFEGITVMDDEKPRLINDLGSKNLMILRNHGLLTIGRSIPEAFFNMWGLQRSCDIQVATDSCGGKINPVADSVLQKTEKLLQLQHGGAPSGQLEFDAMVRMIDKKDDSYKN
jgi:ribulose-5-phosphate 4-epimerase/fuculose-1-phosphate aldolase